MSNRQRTSTGQSTKKKSTIPSDWICTSNLIVI
jgi:hypothetical protein